MHRFLATCLLSILCIGAASAQHKITGLADARPGKIRLRWSPASYISWQIGNKYGYTVERFAISENGVLANRPERRLLTPQALKPYTLQQMEAAADQDDRVAAVAEMIYGDGKDVRPEENLGAFFEHKNQNDWRMAMALLSCDLSLNAAQRAGLYLEDTTPKKGVRYLYRIAVARQPKNLVIDTAFVIAAVDEPALPAPPRELALVCGDSAVTLAWLTTFSRGMYTAYSIERSADGKIFEPITTEPIIPTAPDANGFSYYKDSLPENDHKYAWRLRGITPFGEYGPYSQVVAGAGVPAVADRPIMDTMIVLENRKIALHWSLPGDLPKQLTSISIVRSPNGREPFTTIATFKKPVTTYTDDKPLNSNYYKIKGITRNGRAIYSFPYFEQLIDSFPPATPEGLAGNIDSSGIVRLQWDKNTEPDLQGYRVFRANSTKEEPVEITREILRTATFTDTVNLQTLTKNVYYQVIAVDRNYNTSPYSPILAMKRPDLIPPVKPVFTKAYRIDSLPAVMLEWSDSPSDDVTKYTLFSINTKDGSRRQVAEWDSAVKHQQWLDTALQLGNTYYYELTAYDDSGNGSLANSGEIWYETGWRPAIKEWKGGPDQEHLRIQLAWNCTLSDVKQYTIYRAKNAGPFTLYNTLEGDIKEWTDGVVARGNIYKYKISAVLKDDLETKMSKVIEIIF